MNTWSEHDTHRYRSLAQVAVPERETQIALLLTLLPFSPTDTFRIAELGCGEGQLAQALLLCYPHATYIGLDGSDGMRSVAEQRLATYQTRVMLTPFDIAQDDWHTLIDGADVLVSSLCIHHLSDKQKEALFAKIVQLLSPRGALLIADLVSAPRPQVVEIFANQWDHSAASRSLAHTGSLGLYQTFLSEHWNYYRFPDPVDQPSSLFAQLRWLAAAGLSDVDCFWMQAGHAIYGGYREAANKTTTGVSLDVAYQHAVTALSTIA